MPINHEVNGDLLALADKGEFRAIVHGCNCFCRMGKGIAKQISSNYPDAYFADRRTTSGDREKLGSFTRARVNNGTGTGATFDIINAYTQYDYRPTYTDDKVVRCDYKALERVFKRINEAYIPNTMEFVAHPDVKVGIPMIGAGLAGGDWALIERIINKTTPNLDITLVKYEKS